MASQAKGIMTGGAFLTAFAIRMGASNLVIGLRAAIRPLSQLIQLPANLLVEKARNRRLITVAAASLSRLCWLVISVTSFFFGLKADFAVLLLLLIAVSAFGGIGAAVGTPGRSG